MAREVVGRIGRHKNRPDRLAFIRPDGKPGAWFDLDATRESIAANMPAGLTLNDDDTVVREC